jgi:hypothetical protein
MTINPKAAKALGVTIPQSLCWGGRGHPVTTAAFLGALTGGLLAAPLAVAAQQPATSPDSLPGPLSPSLESQNVEAFRQGSGTSAISTARTSPSSIAGRRAG